MEAVTEYASLLRKCAKEKLLSRGKWIHASISKAGLANNTFLSNLLVHMYGRCGDVASASAVFVQIPSRNIYSWNLMLSAYAVNGHFEKSWRLFWHMPIADVVSWNEIIAALVRCDRPPREILSMFRSMLLQGERPDKITLVSVLNSCADTLELGDGAAIHCDFVAGELESDLETGTCLVHLYGKCGLVDRARAVFNRIPNPGVVSLTAMLWVLAANGLLDQALDFFKMMPIKNLVSWNVIITGFAQCGEPGKAIELFAAVDLEGIQPDLISFATVLDACGRTAKIAYGQALHREIQRLGLAQNPILATALLNMYGKCGSFEYSQAVFANMPQKNVASWNAMLAAYARNGNVDHTVDLFWHMVLNGVNPDHVSFVCVLAICSHVGLARIGRSLFVSIREDFFQEPAVEHYRCIVDLLGRVGHLDDARYLISAMPFEAKSVAWTSMIASWRIHCSRHLDLDLDDRSDAAPIVLLSNLCTDFSVL